MFFVSLICISHINFTSWYDRANWVRVLLTPLSHMVSVHHSLVYLCYNFSIRQESSSLGQLWQQCVRGGAQVLEKVLEALEVSDDLRRDAQGLAESPQHGFVVSRVKQQGQILDWVIAEHLNALTWAEQVQFTKLHVMRVTLLTVAAPCLRKPYLEPYPILSAVFAPSDIDTRDNCKGSIKH